MMRSGDKKYTVGMLHDIVGKSRQAYFQRSKRLAVEQDITRDLLDKILIWRTRHPKMGSRTLYRSMTESGTNIPMGINKFENFINEHGLKVGSAKRSRPVTSDGLGKRNYPNLTNGLVINNINELLVADITYFPLGASNCYLFLLKDVYSQRLISLIPSENMKVENALRTLEDLKELRGDSFAKGCIHHSDNGSQYQATQYREILKSLSMRISRAHSCEQNGSIEQMNHIVKNMYLRHYGISTFKQLESACKEVKYLVNNERSVEILGGITVSNFENKIKNLEAHQRPTKSMHDFEI